MNILIKNGVLVDPQSLKTKEIWIEDRKIRAVEDHIETPPGVQFDEVIDAGGMYVLPGIIDAHTHYHLESRGTVTADDFYSGSVAAALGGVTTAIDFADQAEGRTLLDAGRLRKEAAEKEMVIDFGLHQCIFSTPSRLEDELKDLRDLGITTVKIFTTYKKEGYFIGEDGLKDLFRVCRDLEMMVTAHCEDDELIDQIALTYTDLPHPPSLHPVLRPAEAEYRAVKMIGALAADVNAPVYIVHLSSARGAEAVAELRGSGSKVVVETTPHYLLLAEDLLKHPNAQKYIMTPPLRGNADREALWKAIEQEKVQIIATDHCAFTLEQKLQSDDCRTVLPGIPGSEEMLSLIHTAGVNAGRIDIRRLVSLLSESPAKYFGMYPRKGSLMPGTDADIVLFDPNREYVIENGNRHTAAGYSPYDGFQCTGTPVLTMLRGRVIMRDGEFTGSRGFGSFVKAGSSVLFG